MKIIRFLATLIFTIFSMPLYAAVFTDFAPYLSRQGGSVWDPALTAAFSQWATDPTGTNQADVTWGPPSGWPAGSSTEEHEIKSNCSGGASMAWLNAYRDYNSGARYTIDTTHATYYDVNSSTTYDITDGGSCGQNGQPYALYDVYNAPYILSVWGNIRFSNGVVAKRFFWTAKYTNNVTETNSCWSAGSTSATTILQEEAWWDSQSGWLGTGSGHIDSTTNEPDGTAINYSDYQTIAEGIGYSWTYGNYPSGVKTQTGCLRYQWSW